MLPEYTLYLDESSDDTTETFCIAGCIIKNSEIPIIDSELNAIKQISWTNSEMQNLAPVLHSTEFNKVYKNRKNPQLSKMNVGAYTAFNNKTSEEIAKIYNTTYAKLSEVIKNNNIVTLCCIIDRKQFRKYFSVPSTPRLIDDWYDIAMQEILECYTHYLCTVDGIGSIVYEARSTKTQNQTYSLDNKMFHNFCKIKVNGKGISYLTNRAIYERIRFMDIVSKKENYSGLQIADFIAFNYVKWHLRQEKDRTDFMKRIHLAAYNGNYTLDECDLRSCWGVRIIPNNFFKINEIQEELKVLKKSYKNLKTHKNKLSDKLEKIKAEKQELQDKYNALLKQNESVNSSK